MDHRHSHGLNSSMELRHKHCLQRYRPWTPTWPPVGSWTMEVFKGVPIQKMNCSPSWTSCHCSETRWWCYWAETAWAPGLLHTTLPALSSHAAPLHCLSHLSFTHPSGIANCNVSHSTFFFRPNSFTYKYLCNESLVWFNVSNFWSTINTGLSLRRILDICCCSESGWSYAWAGLPEAGSKRAPGLCSPLWPLKSSYETCLF